MIAKTPSEIRRVNLLALAGCVIAVALTLALLLMPLYDFTATVYAKKSANTFVGDEKYLDLRAEAESVVAERMAQNSGVTARIEESITERVNSKGETKSTIEMKVLENRTRTGLDFIRSGLTSGWVLLAMALCALLAVALACAGLAGSADTPWRLLPGRCAVLRRAAVALALIALLLVPVFAMCNNVDLTQQIRLAANGYPRSGAQTLLSRLDAFLFDGAAGDSTLDLMGQSRYAVRWTLWLDLPLLALVMLCAMIIAHGDPRRALLRGALYAFILIMCVITLYPYYAMLISAFRSDAETTDPYYQHLLPVKWLWTNFRDIANRGVLGFLKNSLLLSVGATAVALLCGIPAAYAMARMSFKGKKAFLGFVIMSQMFSPVVLLVGISRLMNTLSLDNSVWGLVFINAAFNQAFAIWLLRGTFVSISPEMEQAAHIDGCNTVSAMIRVLLPMAAPGIVTTLIFVFINAWNEFTVAKVLIRDSVNYPITVGVTQFNSLNMKEWNYLFASALVATIPVVILFMFIEKHLAAGLTAGGVKG